MVALLAALIAWALTLGGGGGGGKPNGKGPLETITPGPSQSGPMISDRPGGRDDEGSTGGETPGDPGSSSSDGSGSGSGSGGSDGSAGGAGAESGGAAGGSGTAGFPVGDDGVPAGSTLADCDGSAVTFQVRAVQDEYAPGERPEFKLTATNSASSACKLAFGPTQAVLTVRDADDDARVWSSADCPWTTNPILLEVPAGGSIDRTIEWNVVRSAPECADPTAGSVGTGGFEVELKPTGLPSTRDEFTLKA
ncbi:hypothetical protein AB0M28_24520 [Streptomyces sp. NPDC051940]|uniref:hypothetical protein n=1 Tax=Streptomyces sp. NPDC051940 TaxID=3155675 RepID=UPI00341C3976